MCDDLNMLGLKADTCCGVLLTGSAGKYVKACSNYACKVTLSNGGVCDVDSSSKCSCDCDNLKSVHSGDACFDILFSSDSMTYTEECSALCSVSDSREGVCNINEDNRLAYCEKCDYISESSCSSYFFSVDLDSDPKTYILAEGDAPVECT